MTWRLHRPARACAALLGCVAAVCLHACARTESAHVGSNVAASPGNWNAFEGGSGASNAIDSRAVPMTPIEITGVPYVRGVKLAWSSSDRVPTYEAANQTLRLPIETKQAVLQIAIVDLPSGADVRVDWYHGEELVFSDALTSHDDGDHFFALVKRDGRRLEQLPAGSYRAVVHDGRTEIKTVRFQIGA